MRDLPDFSADQLGDSFNADNSYFIPPGRLEVDHRPNI
jgi:hypothetical protein